MHLLYVDESGDPGISQYSSKHFILTGLIVSQDNWDKNLRNLKEFRKALKANYGFNQRTEIHANELIRISGNEDYKKFTKTQRIGILKEYARQIPIIFNDSKFINICIDKSQHKSHTEIINLAWGRLIERYDTYLKKVAKDNGVIISDDTDGKKVMQLLRKMRIYNPVKSHFYDGPYNAPSDNIIEDVFQRNSKDSYFIQTVDVVTQLLYRKEYPKGSLKKYGLERQFDLLHPVLLLEASRNDPFGIVRK
ncbi:MAG: DUF3800 domain-containing protein [Bacteroidia bacterium]|nr:DUF3800 domain-containing protein [Bacteroidia bacterium]